MPFRPRCVLDGLLLRCPACRKGKLYASPLRINERCPRCGYVFGLRDGEFTGAMMLAQFFWGALGLYGWFVLQYDTDASAATKLGWIVGCIVVLPLASYRHLKGAWVGIVRAGEELFDEGAGQDAQPGAGSAVTSSAPAGPPPRPR